MNSQHPDPPDQGSPCRRERSGRPPRDLPVLAQRHPRKDRQIRPSPAREPHPDRIGRQFLLGLEPPGHPPHQGMIEMQGQTPAGPSTPRRSPTAGYEPAHARAPRGGRSRSTISSPSGKSTIGRRQPAVAGVARSGSSRSSTAASRCMAVLSDSSRPHRVGVFNPRPSSPAFVDGPEPQEQAEQPPAHSEQSDRGPRSPPSALPGSAVSANRDPSLSPDRASLREREEGTGCRRPHGGRFAIAGFGQRREVSLAGVWLSDHAITGSPRISGRGTTASAVRPTIMARLAAAIHEPATGPRRDASKCRSHRRQHRQSDFNGQPAERDSEVVHDPCSSRICFSTARSSAVSLRCSTSR